MKRAFGIAALAVVIASGIPATAHHSNPLYFDMAKSLTLEGQIVRAMWINPHVLVYLESKNDTGALETWILQGSSLNNAVRQVGMQQRLQPGTAITARVWPPHNPLYVNDAETVLPTRPDDARKSSRIVGAGQVRFANGDVMTLGGGPTF